MRDEDENEGVKAICMNARRIGYVNWSFRYAFSAVVYVA